MCHCFIHSSAHELLGCFRVLAIVNIAAMNRGAGVFLNCSVVWMQLPRRCSGKESTFQCRRCRRWFHSLVGKISWRRKWPPTPVFLPGKSHGRRSLVGYSPWGCKESDTTELLHFYFIPVLEREMATRSSILAWKIPWTKEPGRLQSMGSQRVGHD